jgi:Ca-activated chloride channel family protein
MRVLTLAAVVCLSVLSIIAPAQTLDTGSIMGTVTDAQAQPILGATVRLAARDFTTRTMVTGPAGGFRFDALPPAAYELTASLQGFASDTRRVVVRSNAVEKLTVRLTVAGIQEQVTVSAAAFRFAPHVIRFAGNVAGPTPGWIRHGTEAYDRIEDNAFRLVENDPLSTFSIDVDTASYSNVRRYLTQGGLPPKDAVRIEELINYFRFDYPPAPAGAPFSVATELAPCPWNRAHKLALVGLQAARVDEGRMPRRNLVFLLDVSGSMEPPDKLPLVRTAMRMLVDTLTAGDRVAIVVYAGASGLVLPSTPGDRKPVIHDALARLEAGGSTNGAAGITLAYQIAQEHFVKDGINRVILATDGDFNVGVTNQGDLIRLIEEKREAGVFLSVLGVGTGNLKDSTMEKLADKGNGNYAYLDSVHEARKVLVAEGGSTLVTVAKDVKIQVEFNPAQVAAYRLIGYENRLLRNEDFNDDRKDAGEIGAGHTVTALYEIVPAGVGIDVPGVDPLKYQRAPEPAGAAASDELMTIKLRYKEPAGDASRLTSVAVRNRTSGVSDNVGFAAAVAQFGMVLRESAHRGSATFADAAAMAWRHRGRDVEGYRAEFARLVELAESLTRQARNRTSSR